MSEPPLRIPQGCGRAATVCICGLRMGTENFQKHLLRCPKMIDALKRSGYATFWMRSSESNKQEKEYFIEEVFGPRMDSFRNSAVVPRWRKKERKFKGMILMIDLRSPCRSAAVRCPECSTVFSNLAELESHMAKTNHGLLQCAECSKTIWPWLPNEESPLCGRELSETISTHFRKTGHVGYKSLTDKPPRVLEIPQFEAEANNKDVLYDKEQYLCDCGVLFLHKLSLLNHWATDQACPVALQKQRTNELPKVSCSMCDRKGSVSEMHQHMLESSEWSVLHDCFIIPDEESLTGPFLVDSQSSRSASSFEAACPTAAVQCPVCMLIIEDASLESAIDRLERHMNSAHHQLGYCGEDECMEPLSLSYAPNHVAQHETEGKKLVGTLLDKKAFEVQVDHTNPAFPVGEDQCHLSFNDMRTAYQCPRIDCLTLFNHPEYLQDHLYQTGHGVWVCPDCPAAPTFSWLRDERPSPCSCPIPAGHCLADKRCPEDFLVTIHDKDIKRFYNHLYLRCKACDTLLDIHADTEYHGSSGQCNHIKNLRDNNKPVTVKQVHALTYPRTAAESTEK